MIAPLCSLGPTRVKSLLERVGFEVLEEDEYHWILAAGTDDVPILVPRKVDLVPIEVLLDVIAKAGFNAYQSYLYEIDSPFDEESSDTGE